jgi:hypothetical protein
MKKEVTMQRALQLLKTFTLMLPMLLLPASLPAQSSPLSLSGPIVLAPLSVSAGATGYGRQYVPVAEETFSTLSATGYGPGPEISFKIPVAKSRVPGSIVIKCPQTLRTVPSALALQPDTVYVVEFSWSVRARNPSRPSILGWVSLFAQPDEFHRRTGKRIDSGMQSEGLYVGGLKTPSAEAPYVLEIGLDSGVEISIANLRFLRQEPVPHGAEESPGATLPDAPFPRLGNYVGGLPDWFAWDANGRVKEGLPLMSTAELDRRLALYDVVVGFAGQTASMDPAVSRRLRELNPDIVLLPYIIAHEPSVATWVTDQFSNPLADAEVEFARELDKALYLRTTAGTLVEDPDFPWIAKANISPYCPKDAQGRDYIDYFIEKTTALWFKDGTWDGLFMDNLFAQLNCHILNAANPSKLDADYNLNGRRDETIPWGHEMTARASIRILRELRERFGDSEMLIGNAGPNPELLLAPYVNGYTFEWFNYEWYQSVVPNGFSEAHWGATLSNYRQMEATLRRPVAIIMEATGRNPQNASLVDRRYSKPSSRDIRVQRLAMGTALLGDGFYEYDLFDSLDAPLFFDEWLVDPDGASVDTAAGKGWLGQALGPAVELVSEERVIQRKPEARVGNRNGKELRMDCGKNTLGRPLQYVLEFDWSVEETLQSWSAVGYEFGDGRFDWTPINGLVSGTTGHTRVHVTVPGGQHLDIVIVVKDTGVLAVKNLTVSTAHCGVFRRDFQNGVVLVNATNEPRTLQMKELQGALQRTGLKRIAGRLDKETNNGKPVQGSLNLQAADAVVLCADSLEVP